MILESLLTLKRLRLSYLNVFSLWTNLDFQIKNGPPGAHARICLKLILPILLTVLLTTFYYFNDDIISVQDLQLYSVLSNATPYDETYVFWSFNCRNPNLNPFDPAILQYMKPKSPLRCSYEPLTKVTYNQTTDEYKLEIIPETLNRIKLNKAQRNSLSCCFSELTPEENPKADGDYKQSKLCSKFHKQVTVNYLMEIIRVTCHVNQKWRHKKIYEDIHSTATKRRKIGKKIENQNGNNSSSVFNVYIIGVDSVSYGNMQRQMQTTLQYLRQNNWIEFKGYNKVGENTLPNLMPILTGYSLDQIKESCWPGGTGYFDSCPFIWKNFSAQNYITMYAEDEPTISTFNYLKKGFKTSPVDYYIRPYMKSATKILTNKLLSSLKYCLGPTTSVERVLKYGYDFMQQMNDTHFFGVTWLNSMTHNDLNSAVLIDKILVSYLSSLGNLGVLDSTFVILLSDHGMRFGKFRQTFFGWFEERLPFLFFHIPEKFRELYPEQSKNMVDNSDRLTSPYDVHLTLHKMLDMSSKGVTKGCPHCNDLFEPVSVNRTCSDAGIAWNWCVCGDSIPESADNPVIYVAADLLLDKINSLAANKSTNPAMECAQFQLQRIKSVRRIKKSDTEEVFLLVIELKPGSAVFEGSVAHAPKIKILGDIVRLDSYGSRGDCANTSFTRSYCHCVRKP